MLIAAPGAFVAWQIGFEFGAFDVVAYERVFGVFVLATVVLVTTFVAPVNGFAGSVWSRLILASPLAYLVLDAVILTDLPSISGVIGAIVLLSFPYVLWVGARLMGFEFFKLAFREQTIAVLTVVMIGLAGLYVGSHNDRFVTCRDFERMGDYQPQNCAR